METSLGAKPIPPEKWEEDKEKQLPALVASVTNYLYKIAELYKLHYLPQ